MFSVSAFGFSSVVRVSYIHEPPERHSPLLFVSQSPCHFMLSSSSISPLASSVLNVCVLLVQKIYSRVAALPLIVFAALGVRLIVEILSLSRAPFGLALYDLSV